MDFRDGVEGDLRMGFRILSSTDLGRQWRLLAPFYVVIGYFTFVHVVTIASLRYRFPIEPLLIVLAADPIAALIAYFRHNALQESGETREP